MLFYYIPLNSFPGEDAAILFIYSENLAESGIISYIKNGKPAEGATDFLWMLILSIFYKMGFDTYLSATFLSAFSLLGSAFILLKIADDNENMRFFKLVSLMLLGMPAIFAAVKGFSTLFFGFFILLSIYFYLKGKVGPLVISSLLTCLIRPDGIVFAAPLVASFWILDKKNILKNLIYIISFAVMPGMIYFCWRFQYFNNLFPLPFYVKSNFERIAIFFNEAALKLNMKFIVALTPVMMIVLLGIIKSKVKGKIILLIVSTVILPFCFYSSMMLSQNVAYRFQYPIVVSIIAISLTFSKVISKVWIYPLAILGSLVLMAHFYVKAALATIIIPYQQNITISKSLKTLQCNGIMMVTEAGILPYYSKWDAVDLWGLNTPELSKTLVSPQFVKNYNSDIIVLHAASGHYGEDYRFIINKKDNLNYESRTWMNMVKNVYSGAISSGNYQLFMVPYFQKKENQKKEKCLVCQLQKHFNLTKKRFDRYDMYMIRKDSLCFSGVKKILLEHGAVNHKTYFEKKSNFIKNLLQNS
jgi:hypothetical protein